MRIAPPLLLEVLKEPARMAEAEPGQWELLIRQGRRAGLLARLADLFAGQARDVEIPAAARRHLDWGRAAAEHHAHVIRWEVDRILLGLAGLDIPVMLLKGTAYLMAGLPAARGRLFSDVDILVPRESLDAVERALFFAGYVSNHSDPYDQRYYRSWMHELPPLQHARRGTLLDVHHNIVPDTARRPVAVAALWEGSRRLALGAAAHGVELRVLQPVDMLLHSAVHLFNDGEFGQGLRDLLDMQALLEHFTAGEADFWERLLERARLLGLIRPLYYALRYQQRLLDVTVPAAVWLQLEKAAPLGLGLRDSLFDRALLPEHHSCRDRWSGLARWLLYVRGHYLRMPLPLLLPHLARKALRGEAG
ncbi:nucleotidyltransferase family protein [Thiohalobacter sp. IOR34]|uniref:nucleotidyltransferase domain-containing protein n=1 Tax=Thiohalobacter sp. IOR34 TaxID=3057176 RepID=UPI0025B1C7E0|nr:nucleotidyltransferase family protein [Thiohalobacter sp. IOR34]WJW74427.1 nucleotidyltransferase family protein [Thiohalobacter sp. IOR34]